MTLLLIEQILIYTSLLVSMVCFVIGLKQKGCEEQKISLAYATFSLMLCAGYAVSLNSPSLELQAFAFKIRFFGGFNIFVTLPMLVKYFQFKTLRYSSCIFNIVLTFIAVLALCYDMPVFPWSKWLIAEYEIENDAGIFYLHKEIGWAFVIFVFTSAVFMLGSGFLFIRVHQTKKHFLGINRILLFFINITPAFGYIVERIFIRFTGIEYFSVMPIIATIANIAFIHLLVVRKFCDINELANNVMFDMVNTPAVVLDKNHKITNINSSAMTTFPELDSNCLGRTAGQSLPENLNKAYRDLIEQYKKKQEEVDDSFEYAQIEKQVVICEQHTYSPKLREIKVNGKTEGYILWMEDVTLLNNYKKKLEKEVGEKTHQIEQDALKLRYLRDQMVMGFASLAEHHDLSTKGHLHRTSFYVEAIARQLLAEGKFLDTLDENYIETLRQIAPLHDIGKTYIDERIFNKPAKLTPEEFHIIQAHTTKGAEFIRNNLKENVDAHYYTMAYNVAKYHHEWWNGKGYPTGIVGNDIPLCARIMAVADVYDALISERPYKSAFSFDKACGIIEKQSGTYFDPKIVKAFMKIRPEIEKIAKSF